MARARTTQPGHNGEDSDLLSEIFFSYMFLSILPNRFRKVSRLTGISVPEAVRSMLNHVQRFNRQESPTA